MKILQNVTVKQVLTESSKNELLDKYKSKRLQLQKESEQLRFELKKLEKTRNMQPALSKLILKKKLIIARKKLNCLNFKWNN